MENDYPDICWDAIDEMFGEDVWDHLTNEWAEIPMGIASGIYDHFGEFIRIKYPVLYVRIIARERILGRI